jgi:predicted O-methyltransferase YrrM
MAEEIDYLKKDPVYGDYVMDLVFAERVKEIIDEYNITTWVETGVDVGSTAMTMTKLVKNWIGIEVREESCKLVTKRFADNNITNVEIIQGNSPIVLLDKMHKLDVEHTIFFLDAHWGAYWPILDEIDAISRGKGIIIIHDFLVPDHPELYFMAHGGHALDYPYVKDALTRWSKHHRIEYNTESKHISPCGVLYVFPK